MIPKFMNHVPLPLTAVECGFPVDAGLVRGITCALPPGHVGGCLPPSAAPVRCIPRPADPVVQPPHYQGPIEAIDVIKAALGTEGFIAHCRGNVIKYAYRAGKKSSTTALEDLRKAQQYIQWAIEACER